MTKYILLFMLLLSASAFAQGGWVLQTSGTTQNLTGVGAIDTSHAVAVGAARTILRTVNGGANWSTITTGTGADLETVSFGTDSSGVAAGMDGQILSTQNGGASWITNQEGWWLTFWAAHQLSATTGYLGGINTISAPFVSTTVNGWQTHDSYTFYILHEGSNNEGTIRGIYFVNADTGFAAVAVWDGHGAVARTVDGGQTWTTLAWGNDALYGVCFPTPTIGYICGTGGTIGKTTDGGVTWEPVATGIQGNLLSIHFVNPDTGWAVGENGAVWRTNDGGASGHAQVSGTTATLRSVDFVDAQTGWAVGDGGVIVKTTTGGDSISTNHPPSAFVRLIPQDDSTYWYEHLWPVTFAWTRSQDADGDTLSYHLYVNLGGWNYSYVTSDTVLADSFDAHAPQINVTWRVVVTDGQDSVEASNGQGHFVIEMPDAAGNRRGALPTQYTLSAYPNPFNPTTVLSVTLPQAERAKLRVYNVTGQAMLTSDLGMISAGEHRFTVNAAGWPSGIYLVRFETPHVQRYLKLVLMK